MTITCVCVCVCVCDSLYCSGDTCVISVCCVILLATQRDIGHVLIVEYKVLGGCCRGQYMIVVCSVLVGARVFVDALAIVRLCR